MENKKICSSHFSGLQVFYLFGSIWRLVFYGGMFIFYLQSLRREANSHTAHEKKTHLTAAVHHPKTQRPWISPAESKGLEIVDHCRPGKGHESTGSN
jgi:hypothetical protein